MMERHQTAEQLQSTLYRAYIIGEMASIYGDPNLINTRFDKIASVGKDDIQRVAKTYLTEANRTVVTTLPKPKPESAQKGAN
jgi:predicted Zn-dependent peptidase